MKIKLLTSAIIAAAIASNAFALHITKGKLISHKEWKTGDATATCQPGTKTLQSMQRTHANLNLSTSMPIWLSAETTAAAGHVGESISVSNNAIVSVRNDTETTRAYDYSFNICAEKSDTITECAYVHERIELQPGGEFINAIQPGLAIRFKEPGVYATRAASSIMGANRTVWSESLANITVT